MSRAAAAKFKQLVEELTGFEPLCTGVSNDKSIVASLQGTRQHLGRQAEFGVVICRAESDDLEFYRAVFPSKVTAGMGNYELLSACINALGVKDAQAWSLLLVRRIREQRFRLPCARLLRPRLLPHAVIRTCGSGSFRLCGRVHGSDSLS